MATKALGNKLEYSPNMLVVCRRSIIFVDSKSLTSNNEEGGRSRPRVILVSSYRGNLLSNLHSTIYNADVVKSRLLRRGSTESSTMQMMVCADVHLCRKDLTWEHFAPLLILVATWRLRVE